MKKINLLEPKIAGYTAVIGAVVMVGFFLFRQPPEIRDELWSKIKFYQHKYRAHQQVLIDLNKDYSHIRDVFLYPSGERRETKKEKALTNPLEEVSFNGIIILDKKYLAIYDKNTNNQQLLAEGEEYKGIKVVEIKENSAIIEVNGEKKEVKF
ncbi:MAG: hypothetical protein DRP73_03750 [Candidatus Omnitrophota bacterium]|nr:MAG: hypothetical protein DRP73_03750 [Candidatus Omnitrophota bacterium]